MNLFVSDDPAHMHAVREIGEHLADSLDELWRHHVTLKDRGISAVVNLLKTLEVAAQSLEKSPYSAVPGSAPDAPTDVARFVMRLQNVSPICDRLFRTFCTYKRVPVCSTQARAYSRFVVFCY